MKYTNGKTILLSGGIKLANKIKGFFKTVLIISDLLSLAATVGIFYYTFVFNTLFIPDIIVFASIFVFLIIYDFIASLIIKAMKKKGIISEDEFGKIINVQLVIAIILIIAVITFFLKHLIS